MTLDLDEMTQAEFDEAVAEIKDRNPNLFQFITDFFRQKGNTQRGGRVFEDGEQKTSGLH